MLATSFSAMPRVFRFDMSIAPQGNAMVHNAWCTTIEAYDRSVVHNAWCTTLGAQRLVQASVGCLFFTKACGPGAPPPHRRGCRSVWDTLPSPLRAYRPPLTRRCQLHAFPHPLDMAVVATPATGGNRVLPSVGTIALPPSPLRACYPRLEHGADHFPLRVDTNHMHFRIRGT